MAGMRRALIVDDSALIRSAFSGVQGAAGYVIRTAADGLDAIGKLRQRPTDLVISDLPMPRMSEYQFLAVVRDRFPEMPVIPMSCEANFQGMPKGVAAGTSLRKYDSQPEALLKLISDLIKKSPIRIVVPRLDPKPVQASWDGDGHYVIACTKCLRSLNVRCDGVSAQCPQTTICDHCRAVVCFLS